MDSRTEFANSGFRPGMWAKAYSALEGERCGSAWSALGLPAFPQTPLVPAHFLKEPGVAVTVGLLGPQDVSGFEGLAVLLLGSLDVVLWRAEEEAVRSQVLGGWCRGEEGVPLPAALPPPSAVLSASFGLASLRPRRSHCGLSGARACPG